MGDANVGIAPEIGGVYATQRDNNQALVLDPQGHISVPLSNMIHLAGSILEPPDDGFTYGRKYHEWVQELSCY